MCDTGSRCAVQPLVQSRTGPISPAARTSHLGRIVDIGRCAKCEYFKYKCSHVPEGLRSIWQDALSEHHLLQIQQKKCYQADRVRAASSFPREELYLVTL
jgi:hypothetical protein